MENELEKAKCTRCNGTGKYMDWVGAFQTQVDCEHEPTQSEGEITDEQATPREVEAVEVNNFAQMTSQRIKEIQLNTAYPQSHSVKQALLQVWNECSQQSDQRVKELVENVPSVAESFYRLYVIDAPMMAELSQQQKDLLLEMAHCIASEALSKFNNK